MAVSVRDRTNPISSTAMRLEPLGARATHVMTFRAVTLDWLEHWRSPLTVNCTEAVSPGNAKWLSTPPRATPDGDAVGLAPNGSTLPVPLSGSNDSTMNRGHSVGAKRIAIRIFVIVAVRSHGLWAVPHLRHRKPETVEGPRQRPDSNRSIPLVIVAVDKRYWLNGS